MGIENERNAVSKNRKLMSQLLLYEINENSYQHIYTYNMHTELENYLKSLIVYPAAVFHVKQHISIFASLVIK